jgi:hypothetical protein
VATLGLNPSRQEFYDPKGKWLTGAARRLATSDSLGVSDLRQATDDQVDEVVADCYGYFHRNPYMHWFKDLESMAQDACGTSYFDGSACHLDLVQWATDPVWGQLKPAAVRDRLIEADREFLRRQVAQEHIRLVVINGSAVLKQVMAMGVALEQVASVTLHSKKAQLHVGETDDTLFVGWSSNLQSSFGMSSAFKSAIREKVRELVSDHQKDNMSGDGFLPKGATLEGKAALVKTLRTWLAHDPAPTIGDVGSFGGKPWIHFETEGCRVGLNADTKRQAVQELVDYVHIHGTDQPWHVIANAKGKVNKVVYRTDAELNGLFAYLTKPWTAPGPL